MDPHQGHPNPIHGQLTFYGHQAHHDDQLVPQDSSLPTSLMIFPLSARDRPFSLIHRGPVEEKRMIPMSNLFMQSSNNPTTLPINLEGSIQDFDDEVGHDLQQLNCGNDVSEAGQASSGSLLQDSHVPSSSRVHSGYNNPDSVMLQTASNGPGGDLEGGELWPYATSSEVADMSIASMSSNSLPVAMSMRSSKEHLRYHGSSTFSSGLEVQDINLTARKHGDKDGTTAHQGPESGLWADNDHGTELLLLPGSDAAIGTAYHHYPETVLGKADLNIAGQLSTIRPLKPLNEYLNTPSTGLNRQDNLGSFHGYFTYAGANSTGILRDLSLSLSAHEIPQQVVCNANCSLAGATAVSNQLQRSIYLKAAQHILAELCSVHAGACGSALLYNATSTSMSVESGGHRCSPNNVQRDSGQALMKQQEQQQPAMRFSGNMMSSSGLQQLRNDQRGTNTHVLPSINIAAHQQLHADINFHAHLHPLMERSQLELKRRKLFSMLDELENRFKMYEEKMQVLLMSLETSGVSVMVKGAAPYKEIASQGIQQRFTSLREAIFATNEAFSTTGFVNENSTSRVHPLSMGECNQTGHSSSPRFRMLGQQQLCHQRVLQQVGLFQQPPWRPQRGLPERSVSLLRAWLFDHFLHPYPKDTEKVLLASQTGLTRNQVSNWFINARVRLWKPMVEEMYQEEMKAAERRRGAAATGNPTDTKSGKLGSSQSTIGTNIPQHFQVPSSEKHKQSGSSNKVITMQDLASMDAIQGLDASRFFSKHGEYMSGNQTRPHQHAGPLLTYATHNNMEALGTGRATMATMLEAAQECHPTWPFSQHQGVAFNAEEQQEHYCNSNISNALMRLGSSSGVTLTLGLQQHSGNGAITCPAFESSPANVDDVHGAHRW